VNVVGARTASVRRGGHVERERHVRGSVGLDLLDAAIRLREPAEPLRSHVPAPPHLILDELDQGLRGRRRVLPRRLPIRDRGRRIVVAQARGDLEPFRLDRVPSLVAEVVHLLRVEGERGPRADLGRVHRVAARKVGERVALRGVRQVLAEQVEEAGERGGNGFVPRGDDPLTCRRVVLGDGGEGRGLLGRQCHDALDLRDGAFHDRARGHHAGRDPLARDLLTGIQVRGEGAEPVLVAFEVLGRVRALDRCDVAEQHARPDEMVHHVQPVGAELDRREGLGRDRLQDVHRRAERDVEGLTIDRRELIEGGAVARLRQGATLLADVREAVVVAIVPDRRGEDRFTFEELVPESVGERVCAVGIVHVVRPSRSGITRGPGYPRRPPAAPRRRRSRRVPSKGTQRRARSRPGRRVGR
jgi:hypothetical protein